MQTRLLQDAVTWPAVSSGKLRPTLLDSLERLEMEIERSNTLLGESVELTERTHSAIELYWRRFHDRQSHATKVDEEAAPSCIETQLSYPAANTGPSPRVGVKAKRTYADSITSAHQIITRQY